MGHSFYRKFPLCCDHGITKLYVRCRHFIKRIIFRKTVTPNWCFEVREIHLCPCSLYDTEVVLCKTPEGLSFTCFSGLFVFYVVLNDSSSITVIKLMSSLLKKKKKKKNSNIQGHSNSMFISLCFCGQYHLFPWTVYMGSPFCFMSFIKTTHD